MATYKMTVVPFDRVKTRSGRHGTAKSVTHGDTVHVVWDENGIEFPIKACHLEVLAHNCLLPSWYCSKGGKTYGHH